MIKNLINNVSQLSEDELNTILDQRDENPFDSLWCELNKRLSTYTADKDFKDTFIKLSKATNNHEVCSYIIEDLELINKAKQANLSSPFLDYLIQSYQQGQVPYQWNN